MFAEIGYVENNEDGSGGAGGTTSYDLDIMPITLNAKLERQLTGNLNAYFGGGLGLALVNFCFELGLRFNF